MAGKPDGAEFRGWCRQWSMCVLERWEVGRRKKKEASEGRRMRSGRDESRQRIGFGLFAPWPAALHTVARHEASHCLIQARIN